jgi:hypothetical protein
MKAEISLSAQGVLSVRLATPVMTYVLPEIFQTKWRPIEFDAVDVNSTVSWNVTLCSPVKINQLVYCLVPVFDLEDRGAMFFRNVC